MAVTVFYEDDSDYYSTTFFNDTVTLVEGSDPIRPEALFPYGLGIVATLLIVLLFPESHPAVERGKLCGWRSKLLGGGDKASAAEGGKKKGASGSADDFEVPSILAGGAKSTSTKKGKNE
jgi:hypothetical protein